MAKTIIPAKESERTIDAETMKSVAEFLPMEGFKLDPALLGQEFFVVRVVPTEFNGNKGFSLTLENADFVIHLSAGAYKKARVMKEPIGASNFYKNNDRILLRSEAEEVWKGSQYLHEFQNMKKDQEMLIPKKIRIEYAILNEDRNAETPTPSLNPFYYKGFRKVVDAYRGKGTFPTMDDFNEELLKTGETRIKGLPKELTSLEKFNWVKDDDVSNFRHTLILQDIPD